MNMTNNNRKVLQNSDLTTSFRFGFLGIGMGGTSIASECADIEIVKNKYPYTALLVNTNNVDLDKVKAENPSTRKILIGNGQGAGRDIEYGQNEFISNYEKIKDAATEQFANADYLWLVAGLGGGTGTGSIIQSIRLAMSIGFRGKFGMILTLPRFNEGLTVIKNALIRLKEIKQAMHGLGAIILVDNEKLHTYFTEEMKTASKADYLNFSNRYIAETLHELNVVTSSFSPFDETHFDASEFGKMLRTPGILHFARFSSEGDKLDSSQQLTHVSKLRSHIESGTLSSGYDISESERVAVSILANQHFAKRLFNFEFTNPIEDMISELAPIAKERPVAQYIYPDKESSNTVYFYALFAGLDMTTRISELVQEVNRLVELEKEKERKKKEKDDLFAGFSSDHSTKPQNNDLSFDELFGSPQEESKSVETNDEDILFKSLFNTK